MQNIRVLIGEGTYMVLFRRVHMRSAPNSKDFSVRKPPTTLVTISFRAVASLCLVNHKVSQLFNCGSAVTEM